MNVDEIFYDELLRHPSAKGLEAAGFIHGIYEISDKHFVVLHEEDAEEIEKIHHLDNHSWNSLRRNVSSVANRFNQTPASMVDNGLAPFVFYHTDTSDPKYSYLRFTAIEEYNSKNNEAFVRRIIKDNFGYYRIKQTVNPLPEKCFARGALKDDGFELTQRTISVKVLKQELTYHTLIEKFSINTISIKP